MEEVSTNALRMQVWALHEQKRGLMLIAPEFRSASKLLQLDAEIERIEGRIAQLRAAQ